MTQDRVNLKREQQEMWGHSSWEKQSWVTRWKLDLPEKWVKFMGGGVAKHLWLLRIVCLVCINSLFIRAVTLLHRPKLSVNSINKKDLCGLLLDKWRKESVSHIWTYPYWIKENKTESKHLMRFRGRNKVRGNLEKERHGSSHKSWWGHWTLCLMCNGDIYQFYFLWKHDLSWHLDVIYFIVKNNFDLIFIYLVCQILFVTIFVLLLFTHIFSNLVLYTFLLHYLVH